MPKILGIIQARAGSSRLQEKIMLPILGKPIIWHIYNRLKNCNKINQICIATSTNSLDDVIEKFALNENIDIFRGSEEKIVDRLIGAARKFNADAIVRITGDCPLVDPYIVDQIIQKFLDNPNLDFVSNTIKRTFPDGLDIEIISRDFLEKLPSQLGDSQEWFAIHIIENHKRFNCINYSNTIDLSKLRWTVDYEEDYKFVKAVYQELFKQDQVFHMKDIIDLLSRKPEIAAINAKYPADTSTKLYLQKQKDREKEV
jgi:spore coat polysaccharide biosynthesis protein SpsF